MEQYTGRMQVPHIGRIRVFRESDDLMDTLCVCPRCGRHVLYGNMMMYNGVHSCPNCHEGLRAEIERDKSNDYETYLRKANDNAYEPYRYFREEE